MARRPDPGNKFIDAALKLAANTPWANVSLTDIAEATDRPLSDLHHEFSDKTAVLLGYISRVDEAMLAIDRSADAEMSARDRLFDVAMSRLEILEKDKAALRSIAADFAKDPLALLRLRCALDRSHRWMLEAANIGSDGILGRVRCHGLFGVMLTVIPVWFRDGSDDLSKTMKVLDSRLASIERIATFLRQPPKRQNEV